VKGPRDYEALRAAWENFTVAKAHGRFVAKTVGQAESLVYTDDPTVIAREIERQIAGIDDPEVIAAMRRRAVSVKPKKLRPFRDDRTWRRKSAKARKDSVDKVCVRRMHELRTRASSGSPGPRSGVSFIG
jgi:hypothetical protein